jgi:hypothetical protein
MLLIRCHACALRQRQLILQQLLLFSHWLLIVEQPAQSVMWAARQSLAHYHVSVQSMKRIRYLLDMTASRWLQPKSQTALALITLHSASWKHQARCGTVAPREGKCQIVYCPGSALECTSWTVHVAQHASLLHAQLISLSVHLLLPHHSARHCGLSQTGLVCNARLSRSAVLSSWSCCQPMPKLVKLDQTTLDLLCY